MDSWCSPRTLHITLYLGILLSLAACQPFHPAAFHTVAFSTWGDAGIQSYQAPQPAIEVITGLDDIPSPGVARLLTEHPINYRQSFAILILRGAGAAGSTIAVHQVQREDTTITVKVAFQDPTKRPGVLASPFHLIAVSKAALSLDDVQGQPIRFVLQAADQPVAETTTVLP